MFNLNKRGSIIILVISIVIVVLVVVSIGGVIFWKYLQKPEKEPEDKEEREDVGVRDCGVSEIFLEEWYSPEEIDFEKNAVMVCMGKSIQGDCENAKSSVKLEKINVTYKIFKVDESDCRVRIEYEHEEEGSGYAECPTSVLNSFFEEEDFGLEFEEVMSAPGGQASFFFLFLLFSADDPEEFWNMGCMVKTPEVAGMRHKRIYDSQIKSELSQVRLDMEMYYIDNDKHIYTGYTLLDLVPPDCSDDTYAVQISPDGQQYLAYARLCSKEDTFWCVDSIGSVKEVVVESMPTNIYTCP